MPGDHRPNHSLLNEDSAFLQDQRSTVCFPCTFNLSPNMQTAWCSQTVPAASFSTSRCKLQSRPFFQPRRGRQQLQCSASIVNKTNLPEEFAEANGYRLQFVVFSRLAPEQTTSILQEHLSEHEKWLKALGDQLAFHGPFLNAEVRKTSLSSCCSRYTIHRLPVIGIPRSLAKLNLTMPSEGATRRPVKQQHPHWYHIGRGIRLP